MLLFALVLLVAGGVIAYVGDRLGTYIGKKRLSAWGLRPRHTAMLYTVLSGGAIAVLTLCALIAYDHAVQTALLRGPELLAENRLLTRENREQRALVSAREARAVAADARAAAASQRAGDALRQALDAELRLRGSRGRLRAAQSALGRSRDGLRQRQAQLGDARRRLASIVGSLGGTRADLRSARTRLLAAQRAVADADHGVRQAQAQYDHALGTVGDLAQWGQLLSKRNGEMAARNAALDAKNQQLLTQTMYLQGAHLIYHKGQELDRCVIPPGLSAAAVRQRLVAFLLALSRQAVGAGATPGDNDRAVRVVTEAPATQAPATQAPGASGGDVSEDDALDALAQNIAQEGSAVPGVVVVAAAHLNTFRGEQVPVEVQPYDNALVFARGAIVADTTVDGSRPEDQILSALQTFLTQRVQTAARRQGIIPRTDPETGEPAVGERTDSAQTLALVKQIQRIGPGARVTARAAAAAYSSGPLRLELLAAPPIPVLAPAAPPAPAPPPALARRG